MVFGLKGNVGLAVIRRLIVRIRIDAEHTEITRVARPYPVVGVSAEFPHRRRRRSYEPDIAVSFCGDQVKAVAKIKRHHLSVEAGAIRGLGNQVRFCRLGIFRIAHKLRDVLDAVNKGGDQVRVGQLFRARHRPKAIRQVVVFHRAVVRDLAIPAVMIGQQQALPADHLCGASAIKMNDGIFQTAFVDAVDVLCGQVQAHRLHVPFDCLQQSRNPHALLRLEGSVGKGECGE